MNSSKTSPSADPLKESQPEDYDLVILGGGTGSTVAAWTFAAEGKRVAVVDRKYMAVPVQILHACQARTSSTVRRLHHNFRRSKEFGISHDGFTIDMPGVRDRKRKMVTGLNEMYLDNYRKTGAEFILGTGRFIAPRTVEVTLSDGTGRQLRGANVIVSTGTGATVGAIPGLAEAQPLTHIEALEPGQNLWFRSVQKCGAGEKAPINILDGPVFGGCVKVSLPEPLVWGTHSGAPIRK